MRISDWSSDVCSSDLQTANLIWLVDGRRILDGLRNSALPAREARLVAVAVVDRADEAVAVPGRVVADLPQKLVTGTVHLPRQGLVDEFGPAGLNAVSGCPCHLAQHPKGIIVVVLGCIRFAVAERAGLDHFKWPGEFVEAMGTDRAAGRHIPFECLALLRYTRADQGPRIGRGKALMGSARHASCSCRRDLKIGRAPGR